MSYQIWETVGPEDKNKICYPFLHYSTIMSPDCQKNQGVQQLWAWEANGIRDQSGGSWRMVSYQHDLMGEAISSADEAQRLSAHCGSLDWSQ